MDEKEKARQRLQLRRARLRFRQEQTRKEIIAQNRDWNRGCLAILVMGVAFEFFVFFCEIGVI